MNNKEFQEILIQRTGLQTQEVEALSSVLIDSIVSALAADNCVTIHGFGSFETKGWQKDIQSVFKDIYGSAAEDDHKL